MNFKFACIKFKNYALLMLAMFKKGVLLFFFCLCIIKTKGGNMLNHAIIVGRIVRNPELKKTDSGKKVANITLAVPRSFKNEKGEYDADFIDCGVCNSHI